MPDSDTVYADLPREELAAIVKRQREQLDMRASNVDISNEGTQIILPEKMGLGEAKKWIELKIEELETEVTVRHRIACHPLDGAYALLRAISEIHGWSSLRPTPGFFGDIPPMMITVKISPTETVEVPWGEIAIPGISGTVSTGVDVAGGEPGLIIHATVKRRDKDQVLRLAHRAEELVNTESIYHGKALSISLDWLRNGDGFDPDVHGFKFMDISGVDPDGLIFDDTTMDLLNVSLFAFIKNPQACRDNNIPLKRGVLLEGRYGTGKTLTAYTTAKYAVENGFTYINCEDARDLQHIIQMARRYEPCVIFCEDVDRIVQKERTVTMDALLNTIDGFQSKDSEVMLVLTTNHVENIHKALMRPGRLDSVMELLPPDASAVQRLIRYYAGPRLAADADLVAVGEKLAGHTPAVIREVVERGKIGTIARTGSSEIEGKVNGDDLVVAAESMTKHLDLMIEKPTVMSDVDKFAAVFGEAIGKAAISVMPCLGSGD